MIELDFLFIYEHKVRELENLCLMKYELDKRGYKTKIIFVNDAKNAIAVKPIYHTKVLCMMACYHNGTVRWHVKDFVKFDRVIDLQWENIVYPKDEEREGAYKNYTGLGKDVVHVSWGDQNVKRLTGAAHLDPKKVKLVGHVGMDFLREPLSRYYISREELFEKYDLPTDKQVIFFASPYYGDALPKEYLDDMCMRFGDNWIDYYKFMCDSQKIVLEWFEEICKEHPEIIVVFRPHPGHPSIAAGELEKRVDNFRIIGTESVKQWIVTCDRVYTGNSSVVVEAFFAQKVCELLFPLPITDGFMLKLLDGSKEITCFDDFKASIETENREFPVPRENIEEIYRIDWEIPNYIHFADMAEEVLRDDYYRLTKKQLRSYKDYSIPTRIIKTLCRIDALYGVYLKLVNNDKLKWSFLEKQRELRKRPFVAEAAEPHELSTEDEINSIIDKIRIAIEDED